MSQVHLSSNHCPGCARMCEQMCSVQIRVSRSWKPRLSRSSGASLPTHHDSPSEIVNKNKDNVGQPHGQPHGHPHGQPHLHSSFRRSPWLPRHKSLSRVCWDKNGPPFGLKSPKAKLVCSSEGCKETLLSCRSLNSKCFRVMTRLNQNYNGRSSF